MSYYRMHAMVMNATNWRRDIKRKKNKKGDDIARNFTQTHANAVQRAHIAVK